MATSSAFNTSNQYIKYRIVVTEGSPNIAANTSPVTVEVQAWRTNTGYTTYGTGTCYCSINGTNYSQSISNSQEITYNSYTVLFKKTVTITHDADGSKSIYVSAYINHDRFTSSSQGFTVTLSTIPRYATITQSVGSKTETAITIKWASDSTIDYIWYSTNNGSNWTGINISDGKTGTYTISGLNANTTYKVKTRVRRKDSQLTTDSSALSVTTYSYPYANSMPNFTIGSSLTIGIYNPLGRNVTVSIIGDDGTVRGSNQTTGTTMSPYTNEGWINFWYTTIPNKQKGTYKVRITYGSSVIDKTGGTYSVNVSACKPSIESLTYEDTNSTTTALTGNDQQIIQNQSIVRYTATGLNTKYEAYIKSAVLSVNGISYNLTVNGTGATGGNAKIDSANNVKAKLVLTDSRDLKVEKEIEITMLGWKLPSAICTLLRQNNFYTATNLKVDASYSSLAGKNTITINYCYKKITDDSYSAWQSIQDNTQITVNLDNNYEWNVRIRLVDAFGTTYYNLLLARGIPIVFFDALKNSTGFNCFPGDEESVEVNGANIYKSLFYLTGDSEILTQNSSATNRIILSGMLTNSSKEFWFSIPMPKNMANVTPSVSTLKVNVRKANGGYLLSSSMVSGGYDILNDNTLTVTVVKAFNNILTIEVAKTTAWSDVTNNTPVTVTIENIQIDFS